MRNSQFWLLEERPASSRIRSSLSVFRRHNLPSSCIVELTPDELVYIWPKKPRFELICMVCRSQALKSPDVCYEGVLPGNPCNFEAVSEDHLCQDIDDFLVDGEYLVECGYFYSFDDFRKMNDFTEEISVSSFLGEFPSVRFARCAIEEE